VATHSPLRFRNPLRRRTDLPQRRFRRGVYILPSLFTLANMFCGYACVIYAMRGEYETAAPFIGFAIVLDMLDGRIARLTGGDSEFGVQFDSLADVISFGMAPAILSFTWGLSSLGSTSRRRTPTSGISSGCRVRLQPACPRPRCSRIPMGSTTPAKRCRRC
jgi:hypothetical protein